MSVVSNTVHNAIQNSSRSKIASSAPTLQPSPLLTKMFLAARSLWTNPLLDRYLIPSAISWQKVSSCFDKPLLAIGLKKGIVTHCYHNS